MRAAINLAVFISILTAPVNPAQVGASDKIRNRVDAMCLTVTTLTTTGYRDIRQVGRTGKLLSTTITIFGISLFLRLEQLVLRPSKAGYPCPTGGMPRHDHDLDAVHCKACGMILNIPDDGLD